MDATSNTSSSLEVQDRTISTARQSGFRQISTLRHWLYVLSQVTLVAGIELSDDLMHAVAPKANAARGLADALRVVDFEQNHGFWIEPGIQRFFVTTHHILGYTIGWGQVRPLVDAIYGQGHILFTLAFAFWAFFFRRPLFSFLRNIFVLTNLFAVVLYEAFPLAPPRLVTGLRYDDHSYHFVDPIFGSGGFKLSFNEYAAMPSLHVAWALIVGISLFRLARPRIVRVLGLVYPLVMMTTVIVTGNHYLSDCLSAGAVVGLAGMLSLLIAGRSYHESLPQAMHRLHDLRYLNADEPVVTVRPATALSSGRAAA